jgi:hypothetical protein
VISRWARLLGYHDIEDSRPWDLTETVPYHESWWFRACAAILGLVVFVTIILVLFL